MTGPERTSQQSMWRDSNGERTRSRKLFAEHSACKRSFDSFQAGSRSTISMERHKDAEASNSEQDRDEQVEAAEALTRLSTPPSEQSEDTTQQSPPAGRTVKRVRFAEGPLKGGPADRVTPDGHPKLEGAVATRRRVGSFSATVTEPITKYSIQLLEAELGAVENGPSISRLKRRFGLAPPAQRFLPYVSPGNEKQPAVEQRAKVPLFGKVVDARARKNPQRGSSQQRVHMATPEGQQRSASRLLDLLKPLEGISSH